MEQSTLLQAFKGSNQRVPVWFMRQAGRCLPEYQKLRQKYSLREMFEDPGLAAEVTYLPVKILNVDAAILFADILTLPQNMGFKIRFDKKHGPVVLNPIKDARDIDKVSDFEGLSYLKKAISLSNQKLPATVALIGFAGAPFTVLTYLIEGGGPVSFHNTLNFMCTQAASYKKIMEKLTENTIRYLNFQKAAGIKAFQLFDTWAGQLPGDVYRACVLPYVQKIFHAVDLPSIYYVKNCCHLLEFMDKTKADFLSVCHTVQMGNNSVLAHTPKGVQGNLFVGLLYESDTILTKKVRDLLKSTQIYKRYIFNLSHGVPFDVKVRKLRLVVDTVQNHSHKK